VDFDGSILWDNTLVSRQTLDNYLYLASQQDPQPEIHLQPNRLAKYDEVAKVLSDAQRLGVVHIGFVGNEQYMQ
jgi:biopolymer transport protein ExbD